MAGVANSVHFISHHTLLALLYDRRSRQRCPSYESVVERDPESAEAIRSDARSSCSSAPYTDAQKIKKPDYCSLPSWSSREIDDRPPVDHGGGLRSRPSTVSLNASFREYDPATSRSSLPRSQSSKSASMVNSPPSSTSHRGSARTCPAGPMIQEPPLLTYSSSPAMPSV